jgi:serine/threonine protein kinase/tetratricopeptide (TPR) repeat protein
MALTPHTRLGIYEIVSPLGAGGMGEVYRARDTRLEREVAIKALPQAFARDPERLARFEREAKLLASLNHPNIASIYGLEEVDGVPYLVLELVSGESLAQRLARGAMPLRDTLEVAGQVALAIEAAHERGIVHRDLKPGNVMLTPAGLVKVLDFGLAKTSESASTSGSALSLSPTIAVAATGVGVLLGTAAYMSPEQARGKPVDRRTDVWSFGCVLYECLTARLAFAGETVSDLIARILEREPDWSALPVAAPARVRDLLKRCLQKDAADRPRDIGDLRLELTAIAAESGSHSGITPASAVGGARPSLAVLYFENSTKDPESEYFCAGITEDILTDLSKIKGLRVASRNAVARYRGASVELSRVAAELGVGAVLEGSVRRAGDRVRISAQLVNAADGFHLWAERYDRTLQDVFAVQEEIASSIAEALRVALSPGETDNLVRDRPKDARAYDLYLKGRQQYGRYSAKSLRGALELFRQATQIDSDYALAWAGMADCYAQMNQWGGEEPGWDLTRLGLDAARRASALNPQLPEAYKAEALALRFSGDYAGALAALKKAVQVNPRFTPAITNLCVDAFGHCDVAGAERYIRRVVEIDPQDGFAHGWLAVILKLTSRGDEALATLRRLRQLSDDEFYLTWVYGLTASVHLDRHEDAAAEQAAREGLAAGAEPDNMQCVSAMVAARAGRSDEVRRLASELERSAKVGGLMLNVVAGACLRVGLQDVAMRFMERTLVRDLAACLARLDPETHSLLDLPPLAPRRWDGALVWPLEAPMIDATRHALFREVRIESGLPQGSDVRGR